ncbi:MAG: radical SAM protein [bacterium]|nr:radical SAM protein [bacterium]
MKYEEPVFRPPSEADSLILQVTVGCSHNRCDFCGMYKEKRFRVRGLSELQADLRDAAEHWPGTRRIFLADGDAFALSTEKLHRLLDLCHQAFPNLSRVGTYMNASNILAKSDDDLEGLAAKKLKIGYLGLESGNEQVLAGMGKGATAEEMVEAVRRCQKNGIKMSVMVLLGLGGREKSRDHAHDSAKALNRMNPRYLSLLALMPVEGTPLERRVARGEFQELTANQILEEMKEILERLELQGTIFRSNHASNYLALSGRFPQDKVRLIAELEDCLSGKRGIRDEWMRGL